MVMVRQKASEGTSGMAARTCALTAASAAVLAGSGRSPMYTRQQLLVAKNSVKVEKPAAVPLPSRTSRLAGVVHDTWSRRLLVVTTPEPSVTLNCSALPVNRVAPVVLLTAWKIG